ncbi:gluconokinase [Leptolyngbya sp. FACHB-261]|uniref:gluconokinase n=1 Tax=Leptolyngbya sp. FACHB-261 TaxID=2692806 RepID=UPI0016855B00|nr:gluconokinase [Leptolyngbya sp. FACHB-261]MBD2102909.1 gluconokinase [Leptolyngbya sp. FACHB-261]
MAQAFFIGVDIGTTSTKAIVFSATGAAQGTGLREYPILVPQPGWAEQDPDVISIAVLAAVREAVEQARVSKQDIAALGFSGAMHSLIAIDAQGKPLTHSIIWADNRSLEQTNSLKRSGIGQAIYQRTGTPIHPMSPLPKLLWLQQMAAATFQQAARFVSIKEYVFYQLFGQWIVDYSIASATGLFNLERLTWDEEALALTQVRASQLSDPVPTTHVMRGMKFQYAEAMGLDPDTPVVVGANDGVLANLGVGAIELGQVAITIGTSGAVRTVIGQPRTNPSGRTFCYALTENHWVIGGPTNNGGIVLRWLRDEFCAPEVERAKQLGADPYTLMIEAALQTPVGAEGLFCLPFLSGERAPYWNAQLRGAFVGMGLHHQRAHFIRAVLEGILLNIRTILTLVQELGGDPKEIRASGGFARSSAWLQMTADVLGYDVVVPEVYEGSSFGAAVLAMYGVGAINDLNQVQSLIRISYEHSPDPQRSPIYQELATTYEQLCASLIQELSNQVG